MRDIQQIFDIVLTETGWRKEKIISRVRDVDTMNAKIICVFNEFGRIFISGNSRLHKQGNFLCQLQELS